MRALGDLSASDFNGDNLYYSWFVEIEIPVGTFVRYTDKPEGTYGPNTDINGRTATWEAFDVKVGAITQNQASPLDVSYIDLQNLDNTWSDYGLIEGVRGKKVRVYLAAFDADGVFQGSLEMYNGRADEAQLGSRCKISLVPHASPWTNIVPGRRYTTTCQYVFKEANTCRYSGVDTTCLKTIDDCRARTGGSNEVHFGGFVKLPKANFKYVWGDIQVVPPSAPPDSGTPTGGGLPIPPDNPVDPNGDSGPTRGAPITVPFR